jgi:hypothetical protein
VSIHILSIRKKLSGVNGNAGETGSDAYDADREALVACIARLPDSDRHAGVFERPAQRGPVCTLSLAFWMDTSVSFLGRVAGFFFLDGGWLTMPSFNCLDALPYQEVLVRHSLERFREPLCAGATIGTA